jgi:hypothetical protein
MAKFCYAECESIFHFTLPIHSGGYGNRIKLRESDGEKEVNHEDIFPSLKKRSACSVIEVSKQALPVGRLSS